MRSRRLKKDGSYKKRKYIKRTYEKLTEPPRDMAALIAASIDPNVKLDYAVDKEGLIRRIQSVNCSSVYKGVSLKRGRWVVQMTLNGEQNYLGSYSTEREAALKYADEHRKAIALGLHVPMKSHNSRGGWQKRKQKTKAKEKVKVIPGRKSFHGDIVSREIAVQPKAVYQNEPLESRQPGRIRARKGSISHLNDLTVLELREELQWRMEPTDGMDKAALVARLSKLQREESAFQRERNLVNEKDTGGASASKGPVVWARSEHAKKFSKEDVQVCLKDVQLQKPRRRGRSKASTKAPGIRRSGRISAGNRDTLIREGTKLLKKKVISTGSVVCCPQCGRVGCAGCDAALVPPSSSLSSSSSSSNNLMCPKCGRRGFKNKQSLGGHKARCMGAGAPSGLPAEAPMNSDGAKVRKGDSASIPEKEKWTKHKWMVILEKITAEIQSCRFSLTFVDAYERQGWRKANAAKPVPTLEMMKHKGKIRKAKSNIRDILRELCDGKEARAEAKYCVTCSDTGIEADEIYCAHCGGEDANEKDNDILLCDLEGCNKAFHQKCCEPIVREAEMNEDDWFCRRCSCLLMALNEINEAFDEDYDDWRQVFEKDLSTRAGKGDAGTEDAPKDRVGGKRRRAKPTSFDRAKNSDEESWDRTATRKIGQKSGDVGDKENTSESGNRSDGDWNASSSDDDADEDITAVLLHRAPRRRAVVDYRALAQEMFDGDPDSDERDRVYQLQQAERDGTRYVPKEHSCGRRRWQVSHQAGNAFQIHFNSQGTNVPKEYIMLHFFRIKGM